MAICRFIHFSFLQPEFVGLSGSNLTQQIASVVSDVQIEEVLTQPIFTLSKGFKRRVGLAPGVAS